MPFFSSSLSEEAFIEPAGPIIAMPRRVTITPIMTDAVKVASIPWPDKAYSIPRGRGWCQDQAHVPRAIDCPRATPRYLMESPNVRPPMPHNTPKRMVRLRWLQDSLRIAQIGHALPELPTKPREEGATAMQRLPARSNSSPSSMILSC